MGIAIRVYIVHDDDTFHRIPFARYNRLIRRAPGESIKEYAGKEVRAAVVYMGVEDRKPFDIYRIDYSRYVFDAEGRIDASHLDRMLREAMECTAFIWPTDLGQGVIDSRFRFARQRYRGKFSWTPPPELEIAISEAAFSPRRS